MFDPDMFCEDMVRRVGSRDAAEANGAGAANMCRYGPVAELTRTVDGE